MDRVKPADSTKISEEDINMEGKNHFNLTKDDGSSDGGEEIDTMEIMTDDTDNDPVEVVELVDSETEAETPSVDEPIPTLRTRRILRSSSHGSNDSDSRHGAPPRKAQKTSSTSARRSSAPRPGTLKEIEFTDDDDSSSADSSSENGEEAEEEEAEEEKESTRRRGDGAENVGGKDYDYDDDDVVSGIGIRHGSDSESGQESGQESGEESGGEETISTWKHLTTTQQVSDARELGLKNLSRYMQRIRPFVDDKAYLMLKSLNSGMTLAEHKASRKGIRQFKKARREESDGMEVEEEEEEEKEIDADDEDKIQTLRQPPTLSPGCAMRQYQLEGLSWLMSQQEKGINSILADEMGLGKTLQSISFITYLLHVEKQSGPFLIIVPLSVLANWMNEFHKWSPTLKVMRAHSNHPGEIKRISQTMKNAKKVQVIVTTYDMIKSPKISHAFSSIVYNSIILDEGHRLKNAESGFAKSCARLRARFKLILTGTPVQNNLGESWALLHFLAPDIFTESTAFDEAFNLSGVISINRDVINKSHYLLRPFILRRIKSEVEQSLPPKLETMISCPMTDVQKRWTRSLLYRDKDVLQFYDTGAVQGSGSARSKKLQFLLQQLRKAANHPYLFDGCETPSLDGLPTEEIVSYSGKMVLLDRLLTKLQSAGHRVVIFSQYTRVLDIISDYLSYRDYTFTRLDGSTNRVMRDVHIREYNAPKSKYFVFLLSTRAGGEGVNLFTADTVILFDSDWNPQIDIQAMARVHRIGQTKTVHIYRLVTAGSVEERIVQRAQKKLFLDSMVNRGSSAQAKAMDEREKSTQVGADGETLEEASEVFSALKFGWNAIFNGGGDAKDSSDADKFFSEEDLDKIIDRTRGLDANGKLLNTSSTMSKLEANGHRNGDADKVVDKNNVQVSIDDFDESAPMYDIKRIEGEIVKNIEPILTKVEKRLVSMGINQRNLENGPRTKRSRLIQEYSDDLGMIDVLKVNNYSLEEGEPSVYEREGVRMKQQREEAKKAALKNNMFVPNTGRQNAGRDFTHQDHCQVCWDGGSLICCDYCPLSFHLKCLGLTQAQVNEKKFWACTHHDCIRCARTTSIAGALFRCEQCHYAYCEDCLPKSGVHYTGESERLSRLGYRRTGAACYIICSNDCRKHAHEMGATDVGEDGADSDVEAERELGIQASSTKSSSISKNNVRMTYDQTIESIESCELNIAERIGYLKLTKTEARARFKTLQTLYGFNLRWDSTSRAGKTVLRSCVSSILQCFGLPFISPKKMEKEEKEGAAADTAVLAKVEEAVQVADSKVEEAVQVADSKVEAGIANDSATTPAVSDTDAVVNEVSKDSAEAAGKAEDAKEEELDSAIVKRNAAIEREKQRERTADEALFNFQGVPLAGAFDAPSGGKRNNHWDIKAYRAVIAAVRILSSAAKATLLEVTFLLGIVISKPIYSVNYARKDFTEREIERRYCLPDLKYKVPGKETSTRRQSLEEMVATFLVTLLPQNCIVTESQSQPPSNVRFNKTQFKRYSFARNLLNVTRLCESNAFVSSEIENSSFFTGLSFLLERSNLDLINVKWKGTFEPVSVDFFNDLMKPCRAMYKGLMATDSSLVHSLPPKLVPLLQGKTSERQLRSLYASAGKAIWVDSGSEKENSADKKSSGKFYKSDDSQDSSFKEDSSSSEDNSSDDGKRNQKSKNVRTDNLNPSMKDNRVSANAGQAALVKPVRVEEPKVECGAWLGSAIRWTHFAWTFASGFFTDHVLNENPEIDSYFTYQPAKCRQPNPVCRTPSHKLVEWCATHQYAKSDLNWEICSQETKDKWRNLFFASWMTWKMPRKSHLERSYKEQEFSRGKNNNNSWLSVNNAGILITVDMVNEIFCKYHDETAKTLLGPLLDDEKDLIISRRWKKEVTNMAKLAMIVDNDDKLKTADFRFKNIPLPDPTHWKFSPPGLIYRPFLESGECPWKQTDVDEAYKLFCQRFCKSDSSNMEETADSWISAHKVLRQQLVLNCIRKRIGRWQGVPREDLSMFPDAVPSVLHLTFQQVWSKPPLSVEEEETAKQQQQQQREQLELRAVQEDQLRQQQQQMQEQQLQRQQLHQEQQLQRQQLQQEQQRQQEILQISAQQQQQQQMQEQKQERQQQQQTVSHYSSQLAVNTTLPSVSTGGNIIQQNPAVSSSPSSTLSSSLSAAGRQSTVPVQTPLDLNADADLKQYFDVTKSVIYNEKGISAEEKSFSRKAVLNMMMSKISSDPQGGVPCQPNQVVPPNKMLAVFVKGRRQVIELLQWIEIRLFAAAPSLKAYCAREDIIPRMLSVAGAAKYFCLVEATSVPAQKEQAIHILYANEVSRQIGDTAVSVTPTPASTARLRSLEASRTLASPAAKSNVSQKEAITAAAVSPAAKSNVPQTAIDAAIARTVRNAATARNSKPGSGAHHRPIKPPAADDIYIAECHVTNNLSRIPKTQKQVRSRAVLDWRQMTGKAKVPYASIARELAKQYEIDLKKYEVEFGDDSSSGEDEMADVIICDGDSCNKEFFLDQIGLKIAPEGDWFCNECVHKPLVMLR